MRWIYPGSEAPEPFADFRQILRDLPEDQRPKVIGNAAYTLLRRGIVSVDDLVGPYGIRDLHTIVGQQRITVKTMTGLGISVAVAMAAWDRREEPEHKTVEQKQQRIAEAVSQGMGPHDEALRKLEAVKPTILLTPPKRLSHAAELAALLAAHQNKEPIWTEADQVIAAREFGPVVAKSADRFLAAAHDAIKARKVLSAEAMDLLARLERKLTGTILKGGG